MTPTTAPGMSPANWGRLTTRALERHFLPDTVAEPAVNEAMVAYHQAVAAYDTARKESGTTMTRAEAERADIEAQANAIEKGKTFAGTPNVDTHDAEAAAQQRKVDALALVATRREADLRRTLDEHRQALIATHRDAADKIATEVLEGLDALAAKSYALAMELKIAEWAERWPSTWRGRPKTFAQGLVVERPRGGDVVFADALFAKVREAVSAAVGGPEPEPTAGPLHIEATLTGASLLAEQAA